MACKNNRKTLTNKTPNNRRDEQDNELESKHLQAIAEINLYTYNRLMQQNAEEHEYTKYLEQWSIYSELATKKQDEEYNTKINNKWKHLNKKDPKKGTLKRKKMKPNSLPKEPKM